MVKRCLYGLFVVLVLFSFTSCGPLIMGQPTVGNTVNTPWWEQVKSWSPEQRSNFFFDFWKAQNADYDAMNAIPNKTPELIKLLETKRTALETSRVLIRSYAILVKGGGVPEAGDEEAIIQLLRDAQITILQQGGK